MAEHVQCPVYPDGGWAGLCRCGAKVTKDIATIEDLKPDAKNANKGTERGLGILEDSLRKLGAGRSILVDKEGVVIAGNKTLESAVELGLPVRVVKTDGSELVVVQREDLDLDEGDGRARELAYADNRSSQVGLDWDLERILADVNKAVDLSGLWSEGELKELLRGLSVSLKADGEPDIDQAEDLREKWQTEQGQRWSIPSANGEPHSLYCGPAVSAGIECTTAILDPPFEWGAFEYETALSWVSWRTAVVMGLRHVMCLAARTDFWHWWVWDSGMSRFGGRGQNPMPGCMIAVAFGKARSRWNETEGLAALERHGIEHFEWPVQVVKIQENLASAREWMPYQKPMPLAEYVVGLYSQRGDVIGDPFAGSGTFLIAAENLGRKWRGAETGAAMCAVLLERYLRTFGIEGILL